MKRTPFRKATSIATLALTLSVGSFGLAACGSDDSEASSASDDSSQMQESPSDDMSSDSGSGDEGMDPASQVFGPGCSAVPTSGDGSFKGMATAPVASAASANPLLKTLVKAVTQAGLVDTLNNAEDITVFAPTDDAFGKIPSKQLNAVLKDKKTLTNILTHHVVKGQLTPDQLAGEHDTLAGDTVTVKGSGEDFTVGDEKAKVLCGNIPTANATVYVIDSVLMPS